MGSRSQPGRFPSLAAGCARLLVVGLALGALLYLAAVLRLVVLPLLLAIALATVLHPVVQRLRTAGLPDGAAAFAVLFTALTLMAVLIGLVVPQATAELDDLDVSISNGVNVVQRWAADGVLGLSGDQVSGWLERAEAQLRDNAGGIARGALSGATVALEVLVGLSLTLVLLFFLLKDGEQISRWVRDLFPVDRRAEVQVVGERIWSTLGGYLRGVTLVALFDAAFIGVALLIVGVPLVVPLVLLTFVGAYIPIVGAFVAGLAAVLVALVALGPASALIVAAAVVAVQQVESNFFQPVVVGRSVRLHPVVILLGVTAGGVLAGIVGAIVATPAVAVLAVLVRHARFGPGASEGDVATG